MRTNTSRSTLYVVTTVLGLVGIVTPFLPFTFGISPLHVIVGPDFDLTFSLLGGPFFLAILVSIASIRLVAFGKPRRSELAITYCVSIIMVCGNLLTAGFGFAERSEPAQLYSSTVASATIVVGGTLVLRTWRKGVASELIAVTTLQITYLANALFCLIGFWPDWEIGAKLTMATVVVYATQVLFVVLREK